MGSDRRATELQDDTRRLHVLSAGRVEAVIRTIEQAVLCALKERSVKIHHGHLANAIGDLKTRRKESLHPLRLNKTD